MGSKFQPCFGTRRKVKRSGERLAALTHNALPDTIDCLLELGPDPSSNLVQVWLCGAAHDQEVLFRHATHDRIGIEQFGRLADRPDSGPQGTLFQNAYETPGGAECHDYVDIAIAAGSD